MATRQVEGAVRPLFRDLLAPFGLGVEFQSSLEAERRVLPFFFFYMRHPLFTNFIKFFRLLGLLLLAFELRLFRFFWFAWCEVVVGVLWRRLARREVIFGIRHPDLFTNV